MTKFRKNPVCVDAVQFTKEMAEGKVDLPDGVINGLYSHFIGTLEGNLNVSINDWIITGVKGERYPCKPDIFKQTYEPEDRE